MKALTLTLALSISVAAFSQITTTKVAEAPVKKYDSTENFLGDNPQGYVGQELYVIGQSEGLRKFGYDYFILDYTKSQYDGGNVYKPDSSGIHSKYEDLAGKYFLVLDVLKKDGAIEEYYLKLQEKDSKDIVYFKYQPEFSSGFPFIVTGYFIKSKPNFIGKKYVVKGLNWYTDDPSPLDMKTGSPVSNFERGSIWQVIDFTVEEKFYKLSLILENSKHEQIPLNIDNLKSTHWVWDYDKIAASGIQVGDNNWKVLLAGLVTKGMTKAMCEASWGKPRDIVKMKADDGKEMEGWSYENNNVYFADGIVIQVK